MWSSAAALGELEAEKLATAEACEAAISSMHTSLYRVTVRTATTARERLLRWLTH